MANNMINVTPLIPGHEAEIAADLKKMFQDGVIASAAWCLTLVPEGQPVIDKASRLAELVAAHQAHLAGSGIPLGILLQATMGHGWAPSEPAGFQRFTISDGKERYIFCPLDREFLAYVDDAVRKLARLKPEFFMLDDDTRMFTCRGGCYCPLHIAGFNRRQKTAFADREALVAALAKDEQLAAAWDDFQKESVVGLARTVRAAIDAEAPGTPCIFCLCAGDVHHAPDMTRALTPPGATPTVRINQARYLCDSPKTTPQWMALTAFELGMLPDEFVKLAETDTCPQTRYSCSTVILHTQYAWSLLAGCRGGKLWITSMANAEPAGGLAYRKKLGENKGFYEAISAMRPVWRGPLVPVSEKPVLTAYENNNVTWGSCIFGFMGLPFHFGRWTARNGGAAALTEFNVRTLSDRALENLLSGTVLLDGGAARELDKRGFADLVGCRAKAWEGFPPNRDTDIHGVAMKKPGADTKLYDLAPGAEVRDELFHAPFALSEESEKVGSGLVKFRNRLGGTAYTFAATVRHYPDRKFEALNLLSLTRKEWLLREFPDWPMYYAGDAPVYFAIFDDRGTLTACVVNEGLDTLDTIPLGNVPADVRRAERLCPDGSWREVGFAGNELESPLAAMDIAFFRFPAR